MIEQQATNIMYGQQELTASIAVSLKRIADALEYEIAMRNSPKQQMKPQTFVAKEDGV